MFWSISTLDPLLSDGADFFKSSNIVVDDSDNPTYLYGLIRKLYLFVEGGNPNLKPARREYLFIEMLESIHPQEAELLLQVKDKKLKCRGLTYNLVKETFPELLP